MIIVNDVALATPFRSVNWKDNRALILDGRDYGPRAKRADGSFRQFEMVVLHTTSGIWPQEIRPGFGPATERPFNVVSSWRRDGRSAAAHFIIDFNGVVYQTADVLRTITWNAEGLNRRSVGIECVQDPTGGGQYASQIEIEADLCDWLSELPPEVSLVQREIPDGYHGDEPRFNTGTDNTDYYGYVGHRVRHERGRGDPGDRIFEVLERRGYEKYNLRTKADVTTWKTRQTLVGIPAAQCDGLPGINTRRLFAAYGKKNGLWVAS